MRFSRFPAASFFFGKEGQRIREEFQLEKDDVKSQFVKLLSVFVQLQCIVKGFTPGYAKHCRVDYFPAD